MEFLQYGLLAVQLLAIILAARTASLALSGMTVGRKDVPAARWAGKYALLYLIFFATSLATGLIGFGLHTLVPDIPLHDFTKTASGILLVVSSMVGSWIFLAWDKVRKDITDNKS